MLGVGSGVPAGAISRSLLTVTVSLHGLGQVDALGDAKPTS